MTLLADDKSLALTKLKAFADDKFDVAMMMISVFDRVEKTLWEKRKCWLPAISPFPTMFSRAFSFWVVESRDSVIKS